MNYKNSCLKRATALFLLLLTVGCAVLTMSACSSDEPVGKSPVETVDDLANAKIGVQLGTTGDIYVSDKYKDAEIQQFNKGADAIQSLKQGKVDCVVIDRLPAEAGQWHGAGASRRRGPDRTQCPKSTRGGHADLRRFLPLRRPRDIQALREAPQHRGRRGAHSSSVGNSPVDSRPL